MNGLHERAQTLSAAFSAASSLVSVACPVRKDRALYLSITAQVITTDATHAVVRSPSGSQYRVRIIYGPNGRGWWCSCQDAKWRGRRDGPCKHTIATASGTIAMAAAEMAAVASILTVP